jgi:hypothetical protein
MIENKGNGQVMIESRELYGNLSETAQEKHLEWVVFHTPRQSPRSRRKEIEDHVKRCLTLTDEVFAKS